jgi:hypothetical protein
MKSLLAALALLTMTRFDDAPFGDPSFDLAQVQAVNATRPRLTNGRIEEHPVVNDFPREFQRLASTLPAPAWIGYAAPTIPGERQMCDWSGSGRNPSRPVEPVRLEPPEAFLVMFRVESGQVVRIRSYSVDCPLDGGGRSVHWFTDVAPADSIAFLKTFIASSPVDKVALQSVMAIAMHQGTTALDTLLALARDDARSNVRGNALFWLGQRAGDKAAGTISAAVDNDPDTEVKKRAVFALSQLPRDEGVPLLIQQARTNKNPAVRKQAMFWLGQSKDPRALRFFEEILR